MRRCGVGVAQTDFRREIGLLGTGVVVEANGEQEIPAR